MGRRKSAFTLMEMLVSISLTTVLLLLVSRVFNDTSRTINDSMDVSHILASTRVISDQLFDDLSRTHVAKANGTTQPEKLERPAGFFVIVQERNSSVEFPAPGGGRSQSIDFWTPDADGDGTPNEFPTPGNPDLTDDLIRSDQLIFFRSGNRVESLTPADSTRYDSDARASYVRVWYGHVSPPIASGSVIRGVEPGVTGNNNINSLTLGRQALLILDDLGDSPAALSGPSNTIGKGGNADGRFLDARIDQPFGLGYRVDAVPAVTDVSNDFDQLFKGATDVMAISHPDRDDGTATTMPGMPEPRGWLFKDFFEDDLTSISGEVNDGLYSRSRYSTIANTSPLPPSAYTGPRLTDDHRLPTSIYAVSALGWGFLADGENLIASSGLEYPFRTEQVGRTHAFLAPYVSDFAVEFAADIRDDLGDDPATPEVETDLHVDDGGAITPNASNRWHNLPDGVPDTVNDTEALNLVNSLVSGGHLSFATIAERDEYIARLERSIKWYTADHLVNNPLFEGNPALYGVGNYPAYDPRQPITWRIPQNDATDRIHSGFTAYPPYQTTSGIIGPLGTFTGPSGGNYRQGIGANGVVLPAPNTIDLGGPVEDRAVFVFGHTADVDYNSPTGSPGVPGDGDVLSAGSDGFESGSAKWWPYLLRVRYRLHDGDGSFGSTDSITDTAIAGKWFEQIIALPLN
ncbi:MAG: prepilin-type N-terminal cleavage/methylation domain-containing protein [Planctomycetota bacterium]